MEGFCVGKKVGYELGKSEGNFVGFIEVGERVGCSEGSGVGIKVGCFEGCCVGETFGRQLGKPEGTFVGSDMGLLVGLID